MQQINLYLPEFRPNREPLRSVHMLWATAGVIILLVLFSLYSSYRTSQLNDELAAEKNAVQATQAQLQKLALQQPQNMRAQLDADISRLQAERDRRQQILAVISNQDLGNSTGFSAQLLTLARQSLDTLALETVSLQHGGNYVELSGTARTADQVPLYLQRLRSEQTFAQARFGVMRVERGENSAAPLLFKLAKAEDDKTTGADDYFGGAH